MKLSTRARYALRVMLDVARHGGGETPVPLAAVAHRTDLSHGYLEQLAMGLRQSRLLRGIAGRNGGYMLGRPPSEIRVGDVFEASIGQICLVDCVRDPSICARAERCETRSLYCLLNQQIEELLSSLTLAHLLDPNWVSEHGGVSPEQVGFIPDGPDPCTAAHGPRRGRKRTHAPAGSTMSPD
jgi:Rrf2 family cysteine metabolism transcriptional repressor